MKLAVTSVSLIALALAGFAEAGAQEDAYFSASDGVKIHYLAMGQGSPVLLIHGSSGSAGVNWFGNGVAQALATGHHVIAIDLRGHGKSDKPHDPSKYGPAMARDVVELLDHLEITKAHIHGFSISGGVVSQLLATHPERFITASYGGSGIREVDPKWMLKVPKDVAWIDPLEERLSNKGRARTNVDREALRALFQYPWEPGERFGETDAPYALDLTKITVPVLAIIGEYDRPHMKTHRMNREIKNFKSIVLLGKSHLTSLQPAFDWPTAISMKNFPRDYIEALVRFIDDNDEP